MRYEGGVVGTRQQQGRSARTRREQGSALLIVFVFAAMIAIMLYMELPVAAFEAQRNRERLLIDRGNEYAHAVKLFVRKFGMYPASIDQLQDTNRMRFLRGAYKDPLTGKDDWRLLHAGPNGQLLDSKVSSMATSQNGTSSNSTSANFGTGTAGSSTAGANSGFGTGFNSSSTSADVVVMPVPQRPPAIAANGSDEVASPSPDQNSTNPLIPPGQSSSPAQSGQPTPDAAAQSSGQNAAQAAGIQGNGQPGAATGNANGMDTVRNLLSNPTTPQQASSSGMGNIASGGIAGVASKAQGRSIKTVNDQTDYSLWEFYYDPTKDATRGIAGAAQAGAAQSAAQVAAQNPGSQNSPTSNAPGGTSPPPQQSVPPPASNPPQQ